MTEQRPCGVTLNEFHGAVQRRRPVTHRPVDVTLSHAQQSRHDSHVTAGGGRVQRRDAGVLVERSRRVDVGTDREEVRHDVGVPCPCTQHAPDHTEFDVGWVHPRENVKTPR